MPRERIQQGLDPKTFDVMVAWNKDVGNYVEIATTAADANDRLKAWTELLSNEDGALVPQGEQTEENPSGCNASEPGTSFRFFDGWHVFLNRSQVNDLIRTLRRARNAAFGVDE